MNPNQSKIEEKREDLCFLYDLVPMELALKYAKMAFDEGFIAAIEIPISIEDVETRKVIKVSSKTQSRIKKLSLNAFQRRNQLSNLK